MNTVVAAEFEAKFRQLEDRSRHWTVQDGVDFFVLLAKFRAECWPYLTKNEKQAWKIRVQEARGRGSTPPDIG